MAKTSATLSVFFAMTAGLLFMPINQAQAQSLKCMEGRQVVVPAKVPAWYRACKPELKLLLSKQGIVPSSNAMRALWATAAAHAFKPYGPSDAITYREIRGEPTINCANYSFLALYLFEDIGGQNIAIYGFDGGQLTNHAQLWAGDILLDPTVGIVSKISFKVARSGVRSNKIVDVSLADRSPDFRGLVVKVIREGFYPSSTLLYRYTRADWARILKSKGLNRESLLLAYQ
jgi:hypothetical protein